MQGESMSNVRDGPKVPGIPCISPLGAPSPGPDGDHVPAGPTRGLLSGHGLRQLATYCPATLDCPATFHCAAWARERPRATVSDGYASLRSLQAATNHCSAPAPTPFASRHRGPWEIARGRVRQKAPSRVATPQCAPAVPLQGPVAQVPPSLLPLAACLLCARW